LISKEIIAKEDYEALKLKVAQTLQIIKEVRS